jgi:hypothetical protein
MMELDLNSSGWPGNIDDTQETSSAITGAVGIADVPYPLDDYRSQKRVASINDVTCVGNVLDFAVGRRVGINTGRALPHSAGARLYIEQPINVESVRSDGEVQTYCWALQNRQTNCCH